MKKRLNLMLLFCFLFLVAFEWAFAYPVDGYKDSGIRRVERLRIRLAGEMRGPVPVDGARRLMSDIRLHLYKVETFPPDSALLDSAFFSAALQNGLDETAVLVPLKVNQHANLDSINTILAQLPEPDEALQQKILQLFSNRNKSYSLSLLEITPGRPIRYAALRENKQYAPGSVGKIAIAIGLFAELSYLYPESVESRIDLLKSRMVTAGKWINYDHHKVPLFNPADSTVGFREIQQGDVFSLFEWVDHMLSPSSNAAASTVWKEAMLLRVYGYNYPPSPEEEDRFFSQVPKKVLSQIALSIVNDPLRKLDIGRHEWRLGSFFTRYGKQTVPGGGGSIATPKGLVKFLLRLEQGRVIDPWSSLELKRLLYMTEKRIRYASAPRLQKSAVYFKSGSLYRCREEEGFKCGKYMGNIDNYMNSVAIVEKPNGRVYLVALMSNVLKINSAVEHQSLATFLDRILERQLQ